MKQPNRNFDVLPEAAPLALSLSPHETSKLANCSFAVQIFLDELVGIVDYESWRQLGGI